MHPAPHASTSELQPQPSLSSLTSHLSPLAANPEDGHFTESHFPPAKVIFAANPSNVQDDVLEIVDRAQKELTIEKQLKKLSDTWRAQELGFPSPPDQPEMYVLY